MSLGDGLCMWNATVNGGCDGTCTQYALSAINAEAELESWNMQGRSSYQWQNGFTEMYSSVGELYAQWFNSPEAYLFGDYDYGDYYYFGSWYDDYYWAGSSILLTHIFF